MTRLRVYVNPESRDILLVHAQEKKHADFALSAPWGAVTFQIGTPMCLARSTSASCCRFRSKRRQRSRDSHWPGCNRQRRVPGNSGYRQEIGLS